LAPGATRAWASPSVLKYGRISSPEATAIRRNSAWTRPFARLNSPMLRKLGVRVIAGFREDRQLGTEKDGDAEQGLAHYVGYSLPRFICSTA
jgi:hypothetical protein